MIVHSTPQFLGIESGMALPHILDVPHSCGALPKFLQKSILGELGTMVRKRKDREEEEQFTVKRTHLPKPTRTQLEDTPKDVPAPQAAYQFALDHYSAKCFVDAALMIADENL